jgi:hypothetical protein
LWSYKLAEVAWYDSNLENDGLIASGLGRLVDVPPPQRREREYAIFRQRIGMAESIPARGPQLVEAALLHNVIVPKQDAVERLSRGGKIIIALG